MADAVTMRLATPLSSVDVLRAVLELVATRDRRIAPRLVVLSRAVQEWIDPILYHTITLSRASSTRNLWRTISESSKPAHFFAEHVKNLSISQEAHTAYLAHILFVCTGVACLTYWSIPSSFSFNPTSSPEAPSLLESLGSGPSQGPRLYLYHEPTAPGDIKHPTFADGCFDALRPRRLAASFRSDTPWRNCPDFSRPVFSCITHLSILNNSEEWAFWVIAAYLPSLTHLALDLYISPTASQTRKSDAPLMHLNSGARVQWLGMASMIKDVLHKCRYLCVCIVAIQFDAAPHTTMKALADTIVELEIEDSKSFPFNNPLPIADTRLVFVFNRDPFVIREAHGESEERMWREAERRANKQREWGTGPELLIL